MYDKITIKNISTPILLTLSQSNNSCAIFLEHYKNINCNYYPILISIKENKGKLKKKTKKNLSILSSFYWLSIISLLLESVLQILIRDAWVS